MDNVMKLQRDIQHKVFGGVCSGLANYFGFDVVLVRLLFAIAFFFFGTGFWIYIIMWLIMPAGSIATNRADYFAAQEGNGAETEEVPHESGQGGKNKPNPDNKSNLVVGLVLIGIGALGLLHRFFPEFNWRTAWPILLIALGLYLIIPPKQKES